MGQVVKQAAEVRKVVFACEAGMGSSLIGANQLKRKLKDAGLTGEVVDAAGNIGRGLVGYVLRRSGYDVTFVDVVDEVVAQLNALGRYPVRILTRDSERVETVDGVRALHAADVDAVTGAVAGAQLVTTAVGPGVLPAVAEPIREGLRRHPAAAVNVIACENMTGNSTRLRALVEGQAGWTVPAWAGFPDCVVDRIVTASPGRPPLTVTVEES